LGQRNFFRERSQAILVDEQGPRDNWDMFTKDWYAELEEASLKWDVRYDLQGWTHPEFAVAGERYLAPVSSLKLRFRQYTMNDLKSFPSKSGDEALKEFAAGVLKLGGAQRLTDLQKKHSIFDDREWSTLFCQLQSPPDDVAESAQRAGKRPRNDDAPQSAAAPAGDAAGSMGVDAAAPLPRTQPTVSNATSAGG
jgi:hypothetical protein